MILIIVAFYYFLGFIKKFRIDKENNRLHSAGMGKKIFWFVNGDKGILPWVSVPPIFFSKPLFDASWTQFVPLDEDGKLPASLPEYNSVGQKIAYGKPRKIPGVDDAIVTVSDRTNKIRIRNQQVLVVEINFPLCGNTYFITLGTVFIIKNGRKYLKLSEGIRPYTEREVKDALNPWFIAAEEVWHDEWLAKKEVWEDATRSKRKKTASDKQFPSFGVWVLGEMEKIKIDVISSIVVPLFDDAGNPTGHKMPFKQYLDRYKFKPFGFRFGEMSYELGYNSDVEKLRTERQNQQNKAEEKNTALHNEELQEIVRKTQVNNAEANRKAAEREWKIEERMLDKYYQGEKAIAEAYKAEVLVLGNNENQGKKLAETIIANKVSNRSKKGGTQ